MTTSHSSKSPATTKKQNIFYTKSNCKTQTSGIP